jgi:hypothetical protein
MAQDGRKAFASVYHWGGAFGRASPLCGRLRAILVLLQHPLPSGR